MEQRNNKKGIILLSILAIILIVFVVLLLTGKIDFRKNIKIDPDKDYVYDATYKYDNKYTEFSRDSATQTDRIIDAYGIKVVAVAKEYLKNLKVPFINIETEDAKKANDELEKLYLAYAKEFDSCAADMEEEGYKVGCTQILTYRTYTYDNILSVVVIDSKQTTAPFILNYHTYTFDLSTGNLLNYDALLNKLDLEKNDTLTKLEELAKKKMDTRKGDPSNDLTTACRYNEDENGNHLYGTTNCYEITNQLLEKSIDSNDVLFFVDNTGNLNVLPILYLAFAQNGDSHRYLITLTR